MTANDHAMLPPSGAYRWGHCSGSVVLERQHPEAEKSPEALEGDAAHEVAATVLRDMKQFGQARQFKPGMVMNNGVVLTDEILEAVEVFTDDVLEIASKYLDRLHVEERVDMPGIHPDNWGTPDAWLCIIDPARTELIIWDYKHGHRFVDAFENLQLVDYSCGCMAHPDCADNPALNLRIIQPRNFSPLGPVRVWKTTRDALAPFASQLRGAAIEATGNAASTRVGPWCLDCAAKHVCPALALAADAAMDLAAFTASVELPPPALGVQLRMMHRATAVLEARVAGLEEQASAIIKKGGQIPGYEIQQGTGREQWTAPPEEIFALGAMMGKDLRQPRAITPAQARKAGMDEGLVSAYVTRPPGPLKLQHVSTTLSRKVFSK